MKDNWIDVKDDLPNIKQHSESRYVFTTYEDESKRFRMTGTGYYNHSTKKWYSDSNIVINVVAWTDFPEVYKK